MSVGGLLRKAGPPSGQRSSLRLLKKVLLSMIVLGGLCCFTVAGTFALLNSETQNNRARISSGTLTFGNKVNTTGTMCFSYGVGSSGNVNANCDALFTSSTLMYPGTPATQKVTITNDGSVDAANLSVYMPSCTMVTSPGAPSPGGGNPCGAGGAQFYIQETDASFVATNCVWPTAAPGNCSFAANTMLYLSSVANTAATAVSLGSGPVHAGSRYFVIAMQLPVGASNALQGETAQFSLTWRLSS